MALPRSPPDAAAWRLQRSKCRGKARPLLGNPRRNTFGLKSSCRPATEYRYAILVALARLATGLERLGLDRTGYVRHGALSIENNAAERKLRPKAVGRKGYQFSTPAMKDARWRTCTMSSPPSSVSASPRDDICETYPPFPDMTVSELSKLLPGRRQDDCKCAPSNNVPENHCFTSCPNKQRHILRTERMIGQRGTSRFDEVGFTGL